MATAEKFKFDISFDDGASKRPSVGDIEAERAAAAARKEAYERGLREGKESAQSEIAAASARAAGEISRQLAEMPANLESFKASRLEESLAVAIAIARKILPTFERRHGLEEIKALLTECLLSLIDEPRIVVRAATAQIEALKPQLEEIAKETGFAGHIVLLPAADLRDGQCRVEWADGGAERNPAELWVQIDAVVERVLGTALGSVPVSGSELDPASSLPPVQEAPAIDDPETAQDASAPPPDNNESGAIHG